MAATLLLVLSSPLWARPQEHKLKVVTTLPVYASIARAVGAERVEVRSISRPQEDAHFVKPKPSLALMLKDADLFVTTGLDLELWAPTLVDKSGNARIRDGQPGYVAVAEGVHMLDVPSSASRAGGDVHIYGNPHVHTNPINAKQIAANIEAGLERVDPAGATVYRRGLEDFRRRVDEALYGKELADLLGAELLDPLVEKGTLISFLEGQELDGRPLVERLGGWLGRTRPLRGRSIIAYHKNWIYFTELLGLRIVDYVESKPGIPPSARHVHELLHRVQEDGVAVLLSASYFEASKPRMIAERSGCKVVRVPMGPGADGVDDYFALIDLWIDKLLDAFGEEAAP